MTLCAFSVSGSFAVLVRVVAPEAGQFAAAFQKTCALAEVHGLMPDVPGIIEVSFDAASGRHAVALAAQIVQFGRGEASRVGDIAARRLGRVRAAGSMTCFAADTRLRGKDCSRFGKLQNACGMALKAAQNRRIGSEGLVSNAVSGGVSWSESEATRFFIPGEAVLGISVFIGLRDVGFRLRARAESPAAIRITRQGLRVMRFGLRMLLIRMTCRAGFRTCEILRGGKPK